MKLNVMMLKNTGKLIHASEVLRPDSEQSVRLKIRIKVRLKARKPEHWKLKKNYLSVECGRFDLQMFYTRKNKNLNNNTKNTTKRTENEKYNRFGRLILSSQQIGTGFARKSFEKKIFSKSS